MHNTLIIPIAIITAGIIIGGAVYLNTRTPGLPVGGGNPDAVRPVDSTDNILGSPTAPITIVEYSDFDCPYCKTFHTTLHQIINDYGPDGSVAWVFRNFALTEIHPNAKRHAIAAECVAETADNEAFWAFTDLLYANQPANPTDYAEYAKQAGASPEVVASCIQNASLNGVEAKVDGDRQNVTSIGGRGTPFSLILVDGRQPIIIEGTASYADLKSQIDPLLLNS
jgi:protein-disulfide isomerase